MITESLTSIRKHLPAAVSVALGVVPIVVLIQWFDVPRKLILGWGVLSYGIGVAAFKLPLYHFVVVRTLHPRLSNAWLGVSQGIVSAVTELGSALLFFLFVVPDLTFVQLVGFGAAAGAVEAVVLPIIGNPLKGTPLEQHSGEVEKRAFGRPSLQWLGVLERVLAFLTHIATRGLVYVSVVTGSIIPATVAFTTFAALDGRGYFAHLQKWAFDDVQVLGRFYLYFAAISILQMCSFLFFFFVR